jgi:hypothetical protein
MRFKIGGKNNGCMAASPPCEIGVAKSGKSSSIPPENDGAGATASLSSSAECKKNTAGEASSGTRKSEKA